MSDRPSSPETCICGHPGAAHVHLRRGTDCAFCGPSCPRYRHRAGASEFAAYLLRAARILRNV